MDIHMVPTPQQTPIAGKSFEYSSQARRDMYQGIRRDLSPTVEMEMTPPPVAKQPTTTSEPAPSKEPNTVQKLVERANSEIPTEVQACPGTKVNLFLDNQ